MSQPQKKGWLASMSPAKRTTLGIIIIAAAVIWGVMYGPRYTDTNTTTGDALPPTVTVVGLTSSLAVNRSMVYQGVTITVGNVQQAQSFSDDGKSRYAHVKYIIRVRLHIQAPARQDKAIGIDYCQLSHLVTSDGASLSCKLAQISPVVLPGQQNEGFLDFWLDTPLELTSLRYVLDTDEIAFK